MQAVYQGPISKYRGKIFNVKKINEGEYIVVINNEREIHNVPAKDLRFLKEAKKSFVLDVEDSFDIIDKARAIEGVKKVYVVTGDKIKIYFDDKKTLESVIKKQLKESKGVYKSEKEIIFDIIEAKHKELSVSEIYQNGLTFNITLEADIEEKISDNLELNRIAIAQLIAKTRQELNADLSEELPIVNTTCGAYQFVKNENKARFLLTVLLSNTKIKSWVSGILKEGKQTGGNDNLVKIKALKRTVRKGN